MLHNYGNEDGWYESAIGYTVDKYELKQAVKAEKDLKKAQNPSKIGLWTKKQVTRYGGGDNILNFAFILFNIGLGVYSFCGIKNSFSLWYLTMGTYYTLLAALRFCMMDHIMKPFVYIHMSARQIQKTAGVLFATITMILPLICYFSLEMLSSSRYDFWFIILFIIYTLFKISMTLSKFLIAHNFDISPFSTMNSITYVEFVMAVLTTERYILKIVDPAYSSLVLVVNIMSAVGAVVFIAFLSLNSFMKVAGIAREPKLWIPKIHSTIRQASRRFWRFAILSWEDEQPVELPDLDEIQQ